VRVSGRIVRQPRGASQVSPCGLYPGYAVTGTPLPLRRWREPPMIRKVRGVAVELKHPHH